MNRPAKMTFTFLALFLTMAVVSPCAHAQIQIFSTGGYGTPETISPAPASFGPYGGGYLIPDARGKIWFLPGTGGPPSLFEANVGALGGIFLPAGWGNASEKFVGAGSEAWVRVFNSDGTFANLDPVQQTLFTTPSIAPPGFGAYSGHLFVSDQGGTNIGQAVWQTAPSDPAALQSFRDNSAHSASGLKGVQSPFGLEFTPSGWGTFGNQLLVSDGAFSVGDEFSGPGSRASLILALDPNDEASDRIFATILMKDLSNGSPGQFGLRQMLIAPEGYFLASLNVPGKLLIVSVTGSGQGGGLLGETLVLDPAGSIVGHLKVGSVLAKYDPRGMTFTADGHLLISDTSDPIVRASASDFAPGRGAACSVISAVSKSSLWPPNHDLVNVGLTASSTCSAAMSVSVYSDEDDAMETGDGNFSPDAKNVAAGSLRLRSERNGKGDGRVFLIVVASTDPAGTVAPSCDTVVVPHDQSKASKDSAEAQAAGAKAFCSANAGAAPSGYFVVGDGPIIGPKQ